MKKTIKQLEEEIESLKQVITDSAIAGVLMNKPTSNNTIQNCEFYGVKWDATALKSVQTVAEGLLNLTTLFKSQNITIDAMLKIENPKTLNSQEEQD